jgi:hypothetical protein
MLITTRDVECHLDIVWQDKRPKMDWLGQEDTLVAILRLTDCDNNKKVALVKDCIDAYTKRGFFR